MVPGLHDPSTPHSAPNSQVALARKRGYPHFTVSKIKKLAQKSPAGPPSLVKGRKGCTSIADSLARALWIDDAGMWPCLSFNDLRDAVSVLQGYEVSVSTIRAEIYRNDKFFEKAKAESRSVLWTLTQGVRCGS
jgi:hypothetical protein